MIPHPAPCSPPPLKSCNLPEHTAAIDGSPLPPPIAVADTDKRHSPTYNLCNQSMPTLCLLRRGLASVEGNRLVHWWSSPSVPLEEHHDWWKCCHSSHGDGQGSWSLIPPMKMFLYHSPLVDWNLLMSNDRWRSQWRRWLLLLDVVRFGQIGYPTPSCFAVG